MPHGIDLGKRPPKAVSPMQGPCPRISATALQNAAASFHVLSLRKLNLTPGGTPEGEEGGLRLRLRLRVNPQPSLITNPSVQLTDEQKLKVAAWIADGQKLSEIQKRLGEEFDLRLTYMEARMLVDDLQLTPKDPTPPPAPVEAAPAAPAPVLTSEVPPPGAASAIKMQVDALARPGSAVSGSVTFSDGGSAAWYLGQDGRLGMVPATEGYRPPEADIPEFQMMLDRELQKLGF